MTASDSGVTPAVRPRGRQKHGECAALARRALDLQPALMAVEDVLDDGKAEPRTATLAAAFDVDPIESLGQARDGLARDAFAFILDARRGPARASRRLPSSHAELIRTRSSRGHI